MIKIKKIKVKNLKKKLKKLRKIKVEIFKPIFINNEKTKYLISNYGRVYSLKTKKFLKPHSDKDGYYDVCLHHNGRHYIRIHRLVAMVFIPKLDKNKNQINHKNGKKKDNKKKNLEWCDNSENQIHAYKIGLKKSIGEKKVKEICELLSLKKYKNIEIAKKTNINKDIIKDIKRRYTWKHISKDYKW